MNESNHIISSIMTSSLITFNSYHPDPVPNATGHDIPCVNVNAANLIAFHHVWWLQAVGGQHASNFTRWSSLRSSSDLLDFCNASNTCVITPRDMHCEHESNRFSRVYVKWCNYVLYFEKQIIFKWWYLSPGEINHLSISECLRIQESHCRFSLAAFLILESSDPNLSWFWAHGRDWNGWFLRHWAGSH